MTNTDKKLKHCFRRFCTALHRHAEICTEVHVSLQHEAIIKICPTDRMRPTLKMMLMLFPENVQARVQSDATVTEGNPFHSYNHPQNHINTNRQ